MKQPDQSRKVSSTLSFHSTLRLFLTCDVDAIHMQLQQFAKVLQQGKVVQQTTIE